LTAELWKSKDGDGRFESRAHRCREFFRSPLIGNIINVCQHTSFEIAELRDLLSGLWGGGSTSVYQNDDDIFVQCQVPTRSFYIQMVRAKVVACTYGRKLIIRIVQAGPVYGEAPLNGSAARPTIVRVRVVEISQLTSVSLATMRAVLQSRPRLVDALTPYLWRRTFGIQAGPIDQLLNSTEKRLARTLLILSNPQKNMGLSSTPIHYDQTTIGKVAGFNRSRINQFMNRFRKLGFIRYSKGSFTALQKNRLRSFVARVLGVLSYA
jgi:CRP/FNR family transcriptional regulator, cyclic AMP receptor protein